MNYQELKNELLKDDAFRKEYERHDIAFEIGQMIIRARIVKGWTQAELARRSGKQQSAIARVENGHLPSLRFLEELAAAFGTHLRAPTFAFLGDNVNNSDEVRTVTPDGAVQECVEQIINMADQHVVPIQK